MSASDIRDPFRGLSGPDRRRAVKRARILATAAKAARTVSSPGTTARGGEKGAGATRRPRSHARLSWESPGTGRSPGVLDPAQFVTPGSLAGEPRTCRAGRSGALRISRLLTVARAERKRFARAIKAARAELAS